MRDVIVTMLVFGSLPLILRKPFFGVLVATWLGLMNPHRLCWGFATNMPFVLIVAVTLILGFLISKEPKRVPPGALTWLLGFWWFWMFVTTVTAFYPELAWPGWGKAWRVMLLVFLTIILLNSRERIQALVWVCVISLGIYGVKGGLFTLAGGGVNHVNGPAGSFIGGNNEIGLAMIMTVPLMRYLQLTAESKAVKTGMLIAMGLTLVAILGTQSRGALVGLLAMILYLVLKSRNKAGLLLTLALALPAGLMIMPEAWYARMDTIQTYEQDGSAMGRINAWWTAWYLALDHPLVGGGFEAFKRPTFAQYAPEPNRVHDAHSIYFEVLGEQGFVGLVTFLAIGIGALATLNRVNRFATPHQELTWMRDLSSMVYVSLIGYAVSGAFLGLARFDFYYILVALAIGLSVLQRQYASEGLPRPRAETAEAGFEAGLRRPGKGGQPKQSGLRSFWLNLVGWYSKL